MKLAEDRDFSWTFFWSIKFGDRLLRLTTGPHNNPRGLAWFGFVSLSSSSNPASFTGASLKTGNQNYRKQTSWIRHDYTISSHEAMFLAQRTVLPIYLRLLLIVSVQWTAHQTMLYARNASEFLVPLSIEFLTQLAISILPSLFCVHSQHSENLPSQGTLR